MSKKREVGIQKQYNEKLKLTYCYKKACQKPKPDQIK